MTTKVSRACGGVWTTGHACRNSGTILVAVGEEQKWMCQFHAKGKPRIKIVKVPWWEWR